jgi:lysophospholipase L1-like esterase
MDEGLTGAFTPEMVADALLAAGRLARSTASRWTGPMGRLVVGAVLLALASCSAAVSKSPGAAAPAPSGAESTTTGTTSVTEPTTASRIYDRPTARAQLTDNRVYLLGDSIAESVGPRYSGAVCDALEPLGWNVTVDAFRGRHTSEAVQSLRSHLTSVGQVVVVLIGHNDAIDPEGYRGQLDRLLQLIPDVPRVLLLTNYQFERGRDRMNEVLRELATADPHVELVDWNLVAQGTKGAIRGDGLHLTSVGEMALAQTIATALGSAPRLAEGSAPTCITFRNSQPTTTAPHRTTTPHRSTSTTDASSGTTEAPPTDSSTTDSPPSHPPRTDPPKTDPPRTDPPRTDPPKTDPPSTA